LAAAQDSPATQVPQVPWRQTLFAPQAVPSARVEPASPQEAMPPAQATAPRWQAFAGWQVSPAVQTVVQAPV
jgi:hypothetical protein